MASVVDPRVGGLAAQHQSSSDQVAQQQIANLIAERQAKALREQMELGERQMKIWEAQTEALIQQQKDVESNARLAKELAEEEAIQLKRLRMLKRLVLLHLQRMLHCNMTERRLKMNESWKRNG